MPTDLQALRTQALALIDVGRVVYRPYRGPDQRGTYLLVDASIDAPTKRAISWAVQHGFAHHLPRVAPHPHEVELSPAGDTELAARQAEEAKATA